MDIDTSAIDAGKTMGGIGNPLTWIITWLLELMLKFTTFLLSIAETLFTWIIDPDNMKEIMDNNAIYATWRTVRDVFNIAFIMVLLFSAFCTIFQVSKYGIKTIWLNLVLMALLVNFSYPIARFIIDASNMLMYGLLNNGGITSFTTLLQKSGLGKIIGTGNPDPLYLLSMVVFTFIFAITLLTIAVLLVIRTVTLAIYIIFSPIAFTGSILPGTAMAEAGNKWWTDFMKQCFAGPIIVFMLFVATTMMSAFVAVGGSIDLIAASQVPGGNAISETLKKLIRDVSFLSMPIIILWLGIIKAQESGIAGAQAVVGYGKKAGKWLAKNPALGSVGLISKKSGLTGGIQQKYANWKKTGPFGSDRQAEREAKIGGLLIKGGKGWSSASENIKRKRIATKQKEFEDERLSESEAINKLKSSDDVEKKAAALYLSKKDKISSSPVFSLAMKALAGDEELQKELRGKAKKDGNIKFVLDYDLEHGIEIEEKDEKTGEIIKKKTTDRAKIYEQTLDMSPDNLAKQGSLHDSIEGDEELQKYMRDKVVKDTEYHKEFFKKLSRKQRAAYMDKNLNPEPNKE